MIPRSKNTKNLTNEVRRIFWQVNNFQPSMKYNVDRKNANSEKGGENDEGTDRLS